MAFNLQTFKTRTITALVFAALMLAGIFINGVLFLLLCSLIAFGCFWEYLKLSRKINGKHSIPHMLLGIVYTILPLLLLARLGYSNILTAGDSDKSWAAASTYSPLIPAVIIFSIWINDTMAYIVGSFIGKTPFSKISPKKTWEGTVGGALLCIIAMIFLVQLLPGHEALSPMQWGIVAALAAVFGTLGDLFESKLKRMAEVKDSGSFMPGHGGFLDRFDSLLFAVPAVYIYLQML